jgi:hypothetical protein
LFFSKRNQLREPIHPQDNTGQAGNTGRRNALIIPQVVPAPPEKPKTKTTCRPDQTPWWKTLGEGIALFGGIGLLVVNICQMRATQKAADAAHDTLRIAYRPWVNAESADLEGIVFPPKDRFFAKVKFTLKNTGTSVATDGIATAEVVPDRTDAMLNHAQKVCAWLEPSKAPIEKNIQPRATGFVLAPGNVTPYSVGMGSDEISAYQANDGKFFVFGCVIYRDQFKDGWHHTRFCFQPSGPITNPKTISFEVCDAYGEAD